MATDADNIILLSRNRLNQSGATITVSGSSSGFYIDDAVDNNIETWWKGDVVDSATLTFDCGTIFSENGNRFYLNGNIEEFTLYYSADNVSFTEAYTTDSASIAGLYTVTTPSSSRYWRLVVEDSGAAYPIIYHCGLYTYIHQFDDGENPKWSPNPKEAARVYNNYIGRQWSQNWGEVQNITLNLPNITPTTHDTLKAWFKNYRNRCTMMPQPDVYPAELYETRINSMPLSHRTNLKGNGFAGSINLVSA